MVLAILIAWGAVTPVAADEPEVAAEPPDAAYSADRVIVEWRDEGRGAVVVRSLGLATPQALGAAGGPAAVGTNGQPVDQVLAALRADPAVALAEPDYVVRLAGEVGDVLVVNDPLTVDQYSLDRMRVRDAWSIETGADNVVAVLDTGVQFGHPDLTGRLLAGYDFVNRDTDAADDNGHGTWVSGIIAARANDGFGIAGVTWSDKVLPVKMMDAQGLGYTSWMISGIKWAADHGADVINMSVGGFPYSASVQSAVDYAWSRGAILVGAAGNTRREETYYPASYNHVISVSATQIDDEFTNWSSYGPYVDVSAPGGSVLTTNCQKSRTASCAYHGEHITISGTSFATPNTSAVLALIRARFPTWTNQQVVDRLFSTVDDLGYAGWDARYGRGRVNAHRALGAAVARVPIAAGDALEPNNSPGAARPIALATTVRPSIHPAGDVDTFTVDLPRAGRLDVRVTAVTDTSQPPMSALPINPVVELLTTAGTRLVRADTAGNAAATETASTTLAARSRVIVRVTNAYPNGNSRAYSIRADYVDTVGPRLAGRTPPPGAGGLNRFVIPTVNFDEAVANVTSATFRLRDASTGALVPASVSLDGALREARLKASHQLAAHRTYAVEVTGGVTDLVGNALAATSWSFTTGAYGFYDIAASKFQNEIAWLTETGITAGCGPGRFCPTGVVTREQMASFLARALDLPPSGTDFFTDDAGSQHESDINRLAAAGITGGCAADRFCPRVSVTRAQMASFLSRALELPPTATEFFTDDEGSQHEASINRLAAAGITGGCAAGRYCPALGVTREQMAAFLQRAFGP